MQDIWHTNLVIVSDLAGGGLAIDWYTGEVWEWDHDGGFSGIVAPSWNALLVAMSESLEQGHGEFQDALFYNLPRVDENGERLGE